MTSVTTLQTLSFAAHPLVQKCWISTRSEGTKLRLLTTSQTSNRCLPCRSSPASVRKATQWTHSPQRENFFVFQIKVQVTHVAQAGKFLFRKVLIPLKWILSMTKNKVQERNLIWDIWDQALWQESTSLRMGKIMDMPVELDSPKWWAAMPQGSAIIWDHVSRWCRSRMEESTPGHQEWLCHASSTLPQPAGPTIPPPAATAAAPVATAAASAVPVPTVALCPPWQAVERHQKLMCASALLPASSQASLTSPLLLQPLSVAWALQVCSWMSDHLVGGRPVTRLLAAWVGGAAVVVRHASDAANSTEPLSLPPPAPDTHYKVSQTPRASLSHAWTISVLWEGGKSCFSTLADGKVGFSLYFFFP